MSSNVQNPTIRNQRGVTVTRESGHVTIYSDYLLDLPVNRTKKQELSNGVDSRDLTQVLDWFMFPSFDSTYLDVTFREGNVSIEYIWNVIVQLDVKLIKNVLFTNNTRRSTDFRKRPDRVIYKYYWKLLCITHNPLIFYTIVHHTSIHFSYIHDITMYGIVPMYDIMIVNVN